MERELSLVLDTSGKHRLILKQGTKYEIDEYTSKYFKDSAQIRKRYKKEIDNFLYQYKELLEKSNNPNYRGRIAVVIPENIGKPINEYQRMVLFKKHIVTFNEMLEDKIFMMSFSDYERSIPRNERLVSDFFHRVIRYPWNGKYSVKKYINDWLKEAKKNKKDYYEIVRHMMTVYEMERKRIPSLPTFNERYEKYEEQKKKAVNDRIKKRGELKLQKNINYNIVENSVRIEDPEEDRLYRINGSKYTVDELHLFDLEEIEETSEYIPDGIRKI